MAILSLSVLEAAMFSTTVTLSTYTPVDRVLISTHHHLIFSFLFFSVVVIVVLVSVKHPSTSAPINGCCRGHTPIISAVGRWRQEDHQGTRSSLATQSF